MQPTEETLALVDEFTFWLKAAGFEVYGPAGDWELLRWRRPGGLPFILYYSGKGAPSRTNNPEAQGLWHTFRSLPPAALCGVLAGEPEIVGTRCADGGTCHHACRDSCFRKDGCVPLGGSGLKDDWTSPSTGRLNATQPEMQDLPPKGGGTPPGPEHSFLDLDFSLLEWRLSGATQLEPGCDVHRASAARKFNVPYGEVTDEQRKQAKEENYYQLYGPNATQFLDNELAKPTPLQHAPFNVERTTAGTYKGADLHNDRGTWIASVHATRGSNGKDIPEFEQYVDLLANAPALLAALENLALAAKSCMLPDDTSLLAANGLIQQLKPQPQ